MESKSGFVSKRRKIEIVEKIIIGNCFSSTKIPGYIIYLVEGRNLSHKIF